MTRRLILLLFTVLALGVGLAACGGDDDDDAAETPPAEDTATHEDTGAAGGGGGHITLTADASGALAFDTMALTAPAGDVTIELVNESGLPHNVGVEGNGVDEVSETISSGSTELTVTLEPGEYTFYCAVPGHREGGMEGTLTVE
jgi:plastocyanin